MLESLISSFTETEKEVIRSWFTENPDIFIQKALAGNKDALKIIIDAFFHAGVECSEEKITTLE